MLVHVAVSCQRQPNINHIIVPTYYILQWWPLAASQLIFHQTQKGRSLEVQAFSLQPQMVCCTRKRLQQFNYSRKFGFMTEGRTCSAELRNVWVHAKWDRPVG